MNSTKNILIIVVSIIIGFLIGYFIKKEKGENYKNITSSFILYMLEVDRPLPLLAGYNIVLDDFGKGKGTFFKNKEGSETEELPVILLPDSVVIGRENPIPINKTKDLLTFTFTTPQGETLVLTPLDHFKKGLRDI
jgi:hypothetical protein